MTLRLVAEPWMDRAACLGGDPEAWHPVKAENAAEAKAVCLERCPVRAECLDRVMRIERGHGLPYRFGIWAGLSPVDRVELARQRGEPRRRRGAA